MIEGEPITYSDRTMDAFTGCRRVVEGTRPTSHHAGLLLYNPEGIKQEILAVKDAPNVWGYWFVDDARLYEGDSPEKCPEWYGNMTATPRVIQTGM